MNRDLKKNTFTEQRWHTIRVIESNYNMKPKNARDKNVDEVSMQAFIPIYKYLQHKDNKYQEKEDENGKYLDY